MDATFHEGELSLQERTGVRARMAQAGPRVIRDHMPDQHREFFAQLPFIVMGSVDAQGQPWASVLAGEPGFVSSPDERELHVRARPLAHDPLDGALAPGAAVAVLGIEPHTRRRNRANGHVAARDAAGFTIGIDQSFGNCPKYIQPREAQFAARAASAEQVQRSEVLDEAAQALIRRADTMFIASAHPVAGASDFARAHGVDVSHRGGPAGFVRVDDARTLTLPDWVGNFYFNTLGNLALNPRCGLLFIDFDGGDLIQVAAQAHVIHAGPELASFEGAQRLVRLHVASVARLPQALPLSWR